MDARFAQRCAKAARDIRGGSLKGAPDASQVGERSWEDLARINDAGLLTFDSQAGASDTERAYVDGVMPMPAAARFVDALNRAGRFVGIVLEPSGDTFGGRIPLTRTRDGAKTATAVPVYMEDHQYRFLFPFKTASDRFKIVVCFDPCWGAPGYSPRGLFREVHRQLRLVA